MSKSSNTEQVVQLERQLQEARRSKGPFDPSVHHIRTRLGSVYEGLLLERTSARSATSADACEEVLQGLWRVHYKGIEEYRTAIRRLAAAQGPAGAAGQSPARFPPSASGPNGARRAPQQQQQQLQQAPRDPVAAAALAVFGGLPQTVSSFVSFVTEASGFYHEVMGKLKAQQGLPYDYTFLEDSAEEDGEEVMPAGAKDKDPQGKGKEFSRKEQDESKLARKVCRMVCHRCLIYLGDLVRYKEQASNSLPAAKDWSRACSYYQQAAAMVPWSGNPHNQLAVLATYVEDEFLALYHYYRSLALALPFPTASDNLKLAFDLNLKKYPAALQMGKAPSDRETAKEKGKQREEKEQGTADSKRVLAVRRLMTHMVRVNGIIATRSSLSPFGEVYLEAMKALAELLNSSDSDLPTALAPGHKLTTTPPSSLASEAPSAAVVLRMMALLIYTLHCLQKEGNQGTTGEQKGPGDVDGKNAAATRKAAAPAVTYSQALQRTMLMRHTVLAIFEFAGRIIQRVCATRGASSVPAQGDVGHGVLANFIGNPLVPSVAFFLQWLAVNPSLLVFVPPSQPPDGAAAATSNQAVDREQSARLFLWGQCRVMLNLFLDWGSAVPQSAWSGPSWLVDRAYLPRLYLETLSGSEKGSRSSGSSTSSSRVTVPALWEDLELRGFEPLLPVQQAGTVAVDMLHVVRKEEALRDSWSRVERMVRAGIVICAWEPRGAAQAHVRALQLDVGQGRFFIGGAPPVPTPVAAALPQQRQQQQASGPGPAVSGSKAPFLGPGPSTVPVSGARVMAPPGNAGHAGLPPQGTLKANAEGEVAGGTKELEEEEESTPAWAEVGVGGEGAGTQRGDMQAVEDDFLAMSMHSQQQERDRRSLEDAARGSVEATGAVPNGDARGASGVQGRQQDDEDDEVIVFRPPGNAGAAPAKSAMAAAPGHRPELPPRAQGLCAAGGEPLHAANVPPSSHSLFSSPSLFSSLTSSYSSANHFAVGNEQSVGHLVASGGSRGQPSAAGIIGQQRAAPGAPGPPGLGFPPLHTPGSDGARSGGAGLPDFLSRDPNFTQFLQHAAQGSTPPGAPPAAPGSWTPGSSRAEPSLNPWLGSHAGPGGLPEGQQQQQQQPQQQLLLPSRPPFNPFDQFTNMLPVGPAPNSFLAGGGMGPPPGSEGVGLQTHAFGHGTGPGPFLGQSGQLGPLPPPLPQGVPGPASAELLRQLLLLQQQQWQAQGQQQPAPPPPGGT